LNAFFFIGVARETERIAVQDEHMGKIALVVVVAAGAGAGGHRRMSYLLFDHAFRMALKTQLGNCFFQHAFIRRLVRIMTRDAISTHDGSMHDLLFVFLLMAHRAEFGPLLDKRDRKVPGMLCVFSLRGHCLMTGCTSAFLHGVMHNLVFPHGSVALAGHAGFLGKSCF